MNMQPECKPGMEQYVIRSLKADIEGDRLTIEHLLKQREELITRLDELFFYSEALKGSAVYDRANATLNKFRCCCKRGRDAGCIAHGAEVHDSDY